MRKIVAAAAALSFTALSACGPSGGTGPIISAGGGVSQVQDLAKQICGFLPVAETVLALLNKQNAGSAEAVAAKICAAVAPATKAASRGRPSVDGVTIGGKFVR